MNLNQLRHRDHQRKDQRDRQQRLWKRTHVRGHARAARRDARAVRYLRWLISREERRLRRRLPRVMFDDTSVELIPANAPVVAGYVNGFLVTMPALEARYGRYPSDRRISIDVNGSAPEADFLDIETGDATIPDAPGWFHRHKEARGADSVPGFYIEESRALELVRYLAAHGIGRKRYRLWIAHYTFQPHVCGPRSCGCSVSGDATQWTDTAFGRSLDESRLARSFFG